MRLATASTSLSVYGYRGGSMTEENRGKQNERDRDLDGNISAEEALRSAPPGAGMIDSSRSGQAVSENPINRTRTGRTGHSAQQEGIDVDR
jgi:hypothetical protein